MEKQLYPGIAFSPQATITDNIGAADTIVKVSDVSAFPEAPNLATIGIDEDGETILYTAKTENALSGCQRGIEGTAKAWSDGEIIGRNFTAKDHDDIIENLTVIESSVTAINEAKGAAGGFAMLGADGILAETQRPDLSHFQTQIDELRAELAALRRDAICVSQELEEEGQAHESE